MGLGNWLRSLLGSPTPPEPVPFTFPNSQPLTAPARVPDVSPADDERVDRAVEVMLRHPGADEDELLVLLAGCGLTPEVAWRTYQFLMIAFTHVVMRERAKFSPRYVLYDPDTGVKSSHLLTDQPLYVAGVAAADRRLGGGCAPQQLLPIFGRSAEYQAIRQGGVWLTDTVLLPLRA